MTTRSHHYSRRVNLIDQLRDRAIYFGAGTAVSPLIVIAWNVYQSTH
jgi:hypothetical protein